MASSYNLRMRQKQQSPTPKKPSQQASESPTKICPKTTHKCSPNAPQPPESPPKIISASSTLTGSPTDLHTNSLTNNQIFNAELNSNSQVDSLINNISVLSRKAKGDGVEGERQDQGADSVLVEGDGLFAKGLAGRGLRRYYSQMEIQSERKEYRSIRYPAASGVPFRKFQTQMEQKIVSLINKMKQQKNCAKEIEKLFSKIENAPCKELKNKYFVSGVAILLKLMSEPDQAKFYPSELQVQSQNIFHSLKNRIESQILEKVDDFEQEYKDQSPAIQVNKSKLINRVFKILRKKHTSKREDLQLRSVGLVGQFQTEGIIDVRLLFQRLGQM